LATVITNLLSAIPVFGQDIVESDNATNLYSCLIHSLDTLDTLGLNSVLPTIGTVSYQSLKKGRGIRLDKEEYLSIPYPFIAFLVGLVDGDGYIQITKTTKGFIAIKLAIEISLEDNSTLEYIYSVLKLGKITKYPDRKNPTCKYVINKTDLQEIFFPLLLHYNIFFLSENRRAQFDLVMYIFKNDIKIYNNIFQKISVRDIPTIFNLPNKAIDYLNLAFFNNWVVGFTNAASACGWSATYPKEGSFCIKNNNDGCFQVKQKIHVNLFEAFKLLFKTERKISIEQNKYAQFSVCSKLDIQNVINFFSFSGLHPLIGLKNIQYFK
jgi:LAGLIDADG endonuclease